MPMLDRLVERVLAGRVDDLVRRSIAEHTALEPHVEPEDPLHRQLVHGDQSRLHVAPTAILNNALINLSGGEVTVKDWAFFGHNVAILTGTHDVEKFGRDRQLAITREGRDVVIGEGVWVSSFAIVIGPCTIGEHAVVGVGSLVLHDVEPFTVVAGSPAKEIKKIEARP
jgi:acetyltransferase-like isoleucine patch superfamily enzyme